MDDDPPCHPEHPWTSHYPANVDWHRDIPVRPLHALLDDAVARFAARPFLDFLGKRYSYRDTARLVAKAALGFQRLGVGKGVKVGLFLPNCPYGVICYFSILKAGGTVVNYNPLSAAREIMHQIRDSETEIMVTLDVASLYGKLRAALAGTQLQRVIICPMSEILPFAKATLYRVTQRRQRASPPHDERHLWFNDLIANDGAYAPVAVAEQSDVAVLQYTGGTTGDPKGVMLSHQNVYANTFQIRTWFTRADPGRERLLAILPFFHCFGMTAVMNFAVSLGSELVIFPRFDLTEVLRAIERRRVTILVGVPTVFRAINEYAHVSRYDLSSLKICISGGDSLPRSVREKFVLLTGCPLAEGYGLTEAAPVATCSNPLEGIDRPGSCGLPLPQTAIEIVSANGTALAPGQVGEICVAGPQVMLGYWQQPEATRECLADGRLRTGDIGRMDEDGFLYFVDRLKEVITVHGYKVYPRMIEEAIRLHPAVAEVAVIGVPDGTRGQVPKACIVLRSGTTLMRDELRAFLDDKLSPTEIPRVFEFRSDLPKSAAGKPLKRALQGSSYPAESQHPL